VAVRVAVILISAVATGCRMRVSVVMRVTHALSSSSGLIR
jgi:hypothetical protein